MERPQIHSIFLNRTVFVAFLLILGVYFVPPALTGGQLLFDSWAAPVWELAISTGRVLGCGSLSCVPLILLIFLLYTYLLAVVLGGLYRGAYHVMPKDRPL